jgi:hypothetical protein
VWERFAGNNVPTTICGSVEVEEEVDAGGQEESEDDKKNYGGREAVAKK